MFRREDKWKRSDAKAASGSGSRGVDAGRTDHDPLCESFCGAGLQKVGTVRDDLCGWGPGQPSAVSGLHNAVFLCEAGEGPARSCQALHGQTNRCHRLFHGSHYCQKSHSRRFAFLYFSFS